MSWVLGIGGAAGVLAAIVLAWKVVAQGRDFASRLGAAFERADKSIGVAKAETSRSIAAQRIAEVERDKYKQAADGAIAGLETARAELGRAKALADKRATTIEALQEVIDRADTPDAVRARLRALLGVSRVAG